jgi:hypothetical protein
MERIRRRLDIVSHIFYGTALKDVKEVFPVYHVVRTLELANFDLEKSERGCLTGWYKKVQEKAVSAYQKHKVWETLFKMHCVRYRDLFWDEHMPEIMEIVQPYWKGETAEAPTQDQPQGINPQRVVDKQKGRCPLCDNLVENVFGGDYVIQYKKGSAITLETCAVVHKACHKRWLQALPNLELETVEITSEMESRE